MPDTRPALPETDHGALLSLLAAGGAATPRRQLLENCGSPEAATTAGPDAWRAAGLDGAQIRALARPAAADPRSVDWLAQPGHHLIGWHEPDYPALLRAAPNPPLALFAAGNPTLLWLPAVAIVGSRAATHTGLEIAARFSKSLVQRGFATCSGMALGIDTSAHVATLEAGGTTIAVLGSGIDQPYPRSNTGLYRTIESSGVVVSEHPPGTPARREHFPSRNRIIAGLSLGTLVVEAADRSGALITARLAAEAGRDVFAVPGSIFNPMARGCHRLIRDGAGLAESVEDVLATLEPLAATLGEALHARLEPPISGLDGVGGGPGADNPLQSEDYQKLWQALGYDPTPMDQLAQRTGLTTAELSSMLLLMELDGRVSKEHGRYVRKS